MFCSLVMDFVIHHATSINHYSIIYKLVKHISYIDAAITGCAALNRRCTVFVNRYIWTIYSETAILMFSGPTREIFSEVFL